LDVPETAVASQLEGCGVTLVSLAVPYIHAKALVADGTSAYVGSANYTAVSLDQNRELGLIVTDATPLGLVAHQVAADIVAGTTISVSTN
jgi:phosphatidylserine/phosphatidylglycerophosphate/cardiolipin synthase-like enzyme